MSFLLIIGAVIVMQVTCCYYAQVMAAKRGIEPVLAFWLGLFWGRSLCSSCGPCVTAEPPEHPGC
jgi:hypothetical protein